MSARAIKCVFLGYSRVQKGYRCYSPSTLRFYTSADVTFFEDVPYFPNLGVPETNLDQVFPIPYSESVESSPLSSSPPVVIDESPSLLNRYGITYERRLRPHDSAPIPSASTPAPTPSPDLPIVICNLIVQFVILILFIIVYLITSYLLPIVSLLLHLHLFLFLKLFRKLYPIQGGDKQYLMKCQL